MSGLEEMTRRRRRKKRAKAGSVMTGRGREKGGHGGIVKNTVIGRKEEGGNEGEIDR